MNRNIHLIPLGEVDSSILSYVKALVSEIFECSATLGETTPVPEVAFDPHRNRYSADKILQNLKSEPERRLLAITTLDLFIPKVRYLFGLAETPGQKGIVGIKRLRDPFEHSLLPSSRFLTSVAKEAVHEIGHTFGLRHCAQSNCVMAFSRSLADTYHKSMKFCGSCAGELASLMGVQTGSLQHAAYYSDGVPHRRFTCIRELDCQ